METEFAPTRRIGTIFQGVLILVFAISGGYFFYLATQDPSGTDFLLHDDRRLDPAGAAAAADYRLYAWVMPFTSCGGMVSFSLALCVRTLICQILNGFAL